MIFLYELMCKSAFLHRLLLRWKFW